MSIAMFHYQRVKPCKTYDFEYGGINTHNQLSDVSSRASGFCDQDTVTFEKSWHSTGSWRLSESMIAFQSAIGEETQNQWSPLSTLHATSILFNTAVKLLFNSGFFWKMILQARSHCYACTGSVTFSPGSPCAVSTGTTARHDYSRWPHAWGSILFRRSSLFSFSSFSFRPYQSRIIADAVNQCQASWSCDRWLHQRGYTRNMMTSQWICAMGHRDSHFADDDSIVHIGLYRIVQHA